MIQEKQKWLLLLFALRELNGAGTKENVLQHIQQNNYCQKNDLNDDKLKSRKEKKWRISLAFERHHLVEKDCISNQKYDDWALTPNADIFFYELLAEAQMAPASETSLFTEEFRRKIQNTEVYLDESEGQALIERIITESETSGKPLDVLDDKPRPKKSFQKSNIRNVPLRSLNISVNALTRAGHRCELDNNHISFRRKNSNHWYMEPHHLIPLSKGHLFKYTLDREQNIISLCSKCHDQIHYGCPEDIRPMLETLFASRREAICKILRENINLTELFQMYDV